MSITFQLATQTIDADGHLVFGLACPGHHNVAFTCTDPDHIEDLEHYDLCDCKEAAITAAEEACEVCREARDINVSQGNAPLILERLGIEATPFGTIAPADLLGRALLANVGRDDSGVEPTVDTTPYGATWRDFGIRPGYFADIIGQLADLATFAAQRGLVISWG